jgi:hypothetical protein
MHATQSSTHQLGGHSKREHISRDSDTSQLVGGIGSIVTDRLTKVSHTWFPKNGLLWKLLIVIIFP